MPIIVHERNRNRARTSFPKGCLKTMRQYHLDSAVARLTGESLRTIQQRGFGLVRMDSDRPTRSAPAVSAAHHIRRVHAELSEDDLLRLATDA
ncbi:MAG: hypothetical protein JWN70_1284 [Planctomycetaceae bacterium]|nr:hypothetical protein [Planctomycetaceae bacterium]